MRVRRILLIGLLAVAVAASGCTIGIKKQLSSEDIPLTYGSTFQSYVNTANYPVAVSFDLKGPWDFREGPTGDSVNSVLVKRSQAINTASYKQATTVEKVLPSSFTLDFTVFNFIGKDAKAIYSYGQDYLPKGAGSKQLEFEKPERLLVFPLTVGKSWIDELKIKDSKEKSIDTGQPEPEHGSEVDQVVRKQVVARGQVRVPAGTFYNCFMVKVVRTVKAVPHDTQEFGQDTTTIMYIWWAPDVGPVAVVSSLAGETSNEFTQAQYFSRLKDYRIK